MKQDMKSVKTLAVMATLSSLALSASAAAQTPLPTSADLVRSTEGRLPEFFHCLQEEGAAVVSAHRGGLVKGLPENAIATLDYSGKHAPLLMEIDVRATYDGVLVLNHDESLDRTSTSEGPLAYRLYSELADVKLKDADGGVTPYGIPTFDEVLAWSKDRALLRVDLKGQAGADRVIEAVRRAKAEGRVLFTTYSFAATEYVLKESPNAMVTLIIRDPAQLEEARERGLLQPRVQALVVRIDKPEGVYAALADEKVSVVAQAYGPGSPEEKGEAAGFIAMMNNGVQVLSADDGVKAAKALFEAPGYADKLSRCGVTWEM